MIDEPFTPEQANKARAALKKQQEIKEQQIKALLMRTVAKMRMGETCLPFRILLDLEKNNSSEVPPNAYYPRPAATWGTVSLRPPPPGNAEQREQFSNDMNYQERLQRWQAADQAERWKPEEWPYLFARFLLAYDFDAFRNTDWTGDPIAESEAQSMRDYLKKLQQDAKEHPENYFLEPNPRKPEHVQQYDVGIGYIKMKGE